MLVFDALRTVLLNDVIGEDDIRHGETEGYILVEFGDGRSIKRSFTSKSRYHVIIREPNGKETTGTTQKSMTYVVRAFTGFDTIDIAGKSQDLQFVAVDDPAVFLVTGVTPETVLKSITSAVGSHGFDVAKSTLTSEANKLNAELKAHTADLNDQEEYIRTNCPHTVKEVDAMITEYTTAQERLLELREEQANIAVLMKALHDATVKYDYYEDRVVKARALSNEADAIQLVLETDREALLGIQGYATAIGDGHEQFDLLNERIDQIMKELGDVKVCSECGREL
jgi:hypothetical protein